MKPHGAFGSPGPLELPGDGPLQALLSPEPLHPFVVHVPTLSPQQSVSHPPAPADALSCDLAYTMLELCLMDQVNVGQMALGAAVLAHHVADLPPRCPARTFRAQKFPWSTPV